LFVGCACAVIAGCSLVAPQGYAQRDGPEIAIEIRRVAPAWATDVTYRPGDIMDPAVIEIGIAAGTSVDEVEAFSCDVVVPIIEQGDPPDSLGVQFWRGATFVAFLSDMDCINGA
jgi:hypothetical protein